MKKRLHLTGLVRRVRPAATNVSLALLSIAVTCIIAEIAVRIVAPQQLILIRPDVWEPADTVGWLHRPNVATQINTGERTVDLFTDAEGFRVGAQGPLEGHPQVLLIGDSFMEALQVPYEQSTAGLLETALRRATGKTIPVRNAGVGGWGPKQYVLRARALLPQRDYRLVIVTLYMGNDIVRQPQEYFPPRPPVKRHHLRIPRNLGRGELTDAVLMPFNDFLEVRSELFLLFRSRLQTLRMRVGLSPLNFPRHFYTAEAASPEWGLTADVCQEIDAAAAQYGAETLFVFIPTPFQVDSVSFRQYVSGFDLDPEAIDLDQPNRRLHEELTARGLNVYDPLSQFRQARSNEPLYGSVDPHFTPEGHKLFTGLVAPVATQLLTAASEARAKDTGVRRKAAK